MNEERKSRKTSLIISNDSITNVIITLSLQYLHFLSLNRDA